MQIIQVGELIEHYYFYQNYHYFFHQLQFEHKIVLLVHFEYYFLLDLLHLFVDLGYQGISQLHNGSVQIPYKKSKKNPLDEESKEYNHALAKIRVKVENVIRCLKIFRILSDRYRNKRKGYKEKFSIIAGIVNMKNGFV